jgi:hypothetical protein
VTADGPPTRVPADGALARRADALASAHRDEGWAALSVRPGAVTPLSAPPGHDAPGLSVLLPDPEFDLAVSLDRRDAFETVAVERLATGAALLVARAPAQGVALVVPLRFRPAETALVETTATAPAIHLRPVGGDRRVALWPAGAGLFGDER